MAARSNEVERGSNGRPYRLGPASLSSSHTAGGPQKGDRPTSSDSLNRPSGFRRTYRLSVPVSISSRFAGLLRFKVVFRACVVFRVVVALRFAIGAPGSPVAWPKLDGDGEEAQGKVHRADAAPANGRRAGRPRAGCISSRSTATGPSCSKPVESCIFGRAMTTTSPSGTRAEVLERVERRPAVCAERHELAVDHGLVGQLGQAPEHARIQGEEKSPPELPRDRGGVILVDAGLGALYAGDNTWANQRTVAR